MVKRKNDKSFIESLFEKEELTEEDFIKLDKIWRQFLKWKSSHGGLLSLNNAYSSTKIPNNQYPNNDNKELSNFEKSYYRTLGYIDYMKSYKEAAYFDSTGNIKLYKTGYND